MVTGKPKFKDEDDPQIVDNVTAVDPPKSISEVKVRKEKRK